MHYQNKYWMKQFVFPKVVHQTRLFEYASYFIESNGQKMKFSIKIFLRIWSHLLKKSLFFLQWKTAKAYSEPCQTSKMERFAKIGDGFQYIEYGILSENNNITTGLSLSEKFPYPMKVWFCWRRQKCQKNHQED